MVENSPIGCPVGQYEYRDHVEPKNKIDLKAKKTNEQLLHTWSISIPKLNTSLWNVKRIPSSSSDGNVSGAM